VGWPDRVWNLHFGFDLIFWNHMQLCLLAWAIQVWGATKMNGRTTREE
jgi:hypothetical protein